MRENEIGEYMGNKVSFNKMMKNIVKALNFEDGLLKHPSEQRLLFRDFQKMYPEYEDLTDEKTVLIKDIYYNHAFTKEEVRNIIIALRTSRFMDETETEKLVDKIKSELTSKYFNDSFAKIYSKEHTASDKFIKNFSIVSNALINCQQLTFRMNYYNWRQQLVTYGEKYIISPDFIIANNGKYYVTGCFENKNDDKKNLAIIRIDLMSDIQILKVRVTSTYYIPSLWQISEDKFRTLHLNMSYDECLTVEMKIRKTYKTNNEVNYTPLHDSFGDAYTVVRKKEDGDIVRVRCSKYGIVSWAVQYGDLVEVISPESVIEEIKKKIETLKGKYFNEED